MLMIKQSFFALFDLATDLLISVFHLYSYRNMEIKKYCFIHINFM